MYDNESVHLDYNVLLKVLIVLTQKDYSALMEAAAHDHVDVIRVLVSQQDDLGDTEIPTLVSSCYLLLVFKSLSSERGFPSCFDKRAH